MKTAVSLPEHVFKEAERFARRQKKSRSQLYAEALAEYLARHAPNDITEAMNAVSDHLGTSIDQFKNVAGPESSAQRVMVAIAQGDIWWVDLGEPSGSEPGYRRPVVIVQGEPFNRSRIATTVVVPLTSNMEWAAAPGNVALSSELTGLPKDSVANVSQIITLDRSSLTDHVGRLSQSKMNLILSGIDVVLGR